MKKARISDDVFELFPDFYRGIIVVKELTNHKSYKRVRKLLKKVLNQQAEIDVNTEQRVLAWMVAHKRFGSDPEKFPPSIKALLERIKVNRDLPFINSVVALFNYTSLKYLIPCGGDDVQQIEGNLVLGVADGAETFVPLGSGTQESTFPGEVVYYDDATKNIMCRRWNWRNGAKTKIDVETRHIVINVDGLPPVTPEIVDQARDELAELLKEHCQADLETSALHALQREFELPA